MNGNVIEKKIIQGSNSYLIVYFGILFVSVLLISLNGFDLVTTVTSVISCINNVGPGLSIVGPTGIMLPFLFCQSWCSALICWPAGLNCFRF